MTSIILAWLTGEGIMIYKLVQQEHRPPFPAQILSTSGLFALLALLGEVNGAAGLASSLAWGFVAAALLNLWPIPAKKAASTPAPAK